MVFEIFFEKILAHFSQELPFVVYKKPNEFEIQAMLQNDANCYTVADFSESGFVFAPFDTTAEAVLIPSKHAESIKTTLVSAKTIAKNNYENNHNFTAKSKHEQLVAKGIKAIEAQAFKKVVLSRCERVGFSEENPLETFKRMLQNYPTAMVYCWYHPKVGLWLGATPETLLQVTNNRFKTMALAGTMPYQGTTEVSWGIKEKNEQEIVTNYIVDSVKNSVKNITVFNTETVRAGSLLHLKTIITGTLDKMSGGFQKLINSLHPTPAVCGFPKEAAKQFILKHENYNREFYTGYLGELHIKQTISRNRNKRNIEQNAYTSIKKTSHLFVNLRCVQLQNKEALIYVGGGITKESIPENEWQETVYKAQTIKSVL